MTPGRRKRRFRGRAFCKDLAEGIVYSEVRVIENVEEFSAEIQGSTIAEFLDRHVFCE